MLAEWVHPDIRGELGVADGDVSAHSLGEAFPGEIAEDGCCVDEDVSSVFGVA
jgi:hypothetical protein